MKKRTWLVTGGAGFIGSNIAQELTRCGERVRIFDNFSTGKTEHICGFRDKIEVIKGDLRVPSQVARAVRGIDYILHQAAFKSVPKSVDRPQESNENNVTGTLNLLAAAKNAGVKRLVYASSSSVYGEGKIFPQHEKLAPMPVSPYAVSKLAAEHYCVVFAKTYGLQTVSLRYFNVFGPRQNPESIYSAVIPKFMELALKNKPLEVHWDGKQSRDFTYVSDIVRANITAALTTANVSGEVYNMACGRTHSLLDIIKVMEKILGRRLNKVFMPKRAGDIHRTYADASKARRELKFECKVGFEEGIIKTWEYFKGHAR
ncbi:MAG: SDR family oxidoreductase [Elusimicrobia bacterium]|nr:SDR family oxidoreductase [Elusimicrobiota bacterium]